MLAFVLRFGNLKKGTLRARFSCNQCQRFREVFFVDFLVDFLVPDFFEARDFAAAFPPLRPPFLAGALFTGLPRPEPLYSPPMIEVVVANSWGLRLVRD